MRKVRLVQPSRRFVTVDPPGGVGIAHMVQFSAAKFPRTRALNQRGIREMTNDLPGHRFQNLLALIEAAISSDAHTSVSSPAYLYDRDGGAQREFDVLITFRKDHHVNLTAVECKDHRRKIDVGMIDGFATKLADCGVHRGIVVSASGFSETVLKKAKAKGIQLMTLQQAEQFNWFATPTILGSHRMVRCVGAMFGIPGVTSVPEPYQVYATHDEPLTGERLNALALQVVPPQEMPFGAEGVERFNVNVLVEDTYLVDAEGQRYDVTQIAMLIETETVQTDVPFQFNTYSGEGVVRQVATASLPHLSVPSNLIFVEGEDGIKVSVVPTIPSSGKPTSTAE